MAPSLFHSDCFRVGESSQAFYEGREVGYPVAQLGDYHVRTRDDEYCFDKHSSFDWRSLVGNHARDVLRENYCGCRLGDNSPLPNPGEEHPQDGVHLKCVGRQSYVVLGVSGGSRKLRVRNVRCAGTGSAPSAVAASVT